MLGFFKKFILILLLIVLPFSFLISTGCSKDDKTQEETTIPNSPELKKGIHQFDYTSTNDYILKDSNSDYIIVYPKNADDKTIYAVNEFNDLFSLSTGIKLQTSNDENIEYNNDSTYIVIGDSKLLKSANVSFDKKELKDSGYIIKTVGKSIFIAGGINGVYYGVYTFMNIYFGYNVYSEDEIYYTKGNTSVKLYNFNIKDIADIDYRLQPYSAGNDTNKTMRLCNVGDMIIETRGYVWHNLLRGVLPYNLYGVDENSNVTPEGLTISEAMKNEIKNYSAFIEHPEWKNHPEWYVFEEYDGEQSIGGGTVGILDPCNINFSIDVEGWTEEQNQESENMLFDAIIYELRKAIDESNGLKSNIAFTLDDNYAWSKDGKSQAEMQKYGTAAGEYIHYVNKVAKKLKEFYPSIRVTIFAYNQTSIPPVKKDSKEIGRAHV